MSVFYLVRVVGLEPTLFRTRPLNVRVCRSATLASIVIINYDINFVKCFYKFNKILVNIDLVYY